MKKYDFKFGLENVKDEFGFIYYIKKLGNYFI